MINNYKEWEELYHQRVGENLISSLAESLWLPVEEEEENPLFTTEDSWETPEKETIGFVDFHDEEGKEKF